MVTIFHSFSSKVILRKSSGIDESGTIVWQLLLMLIIGWVIVFFTVFRGIKVNIII